MTFVGGPNDGGWGVLSDDLPWPSEGGIYRRTDEEDEDGLVIWRWEETDDQIRDDKQTSGN